MLKCSALLLALCVMAFAQPREASGTIGYNYQYSDQGHGERSNLNGFFASGQLDFSDHLSIVGEVDSYYGKVGGVTATQQNFVLGPQYTFRTEKGKLRPFVYLQSGDQRSASAGNVEHAFDLQLGGGVQINLTDALSLQVMPTEYNLSMPQVGPTHSFSTKLGVSWTFWKQAP